MMPQPRLRCRIQMAFSSIAGRRSGRRASRASIAVLSFSAAAASSASPQNN
jgi:hypothetical protein